MFTVVECDRYLQRIKYQGGVTPCLENLRALMFAHLTSVPFETVQIHRSGKAPDLSLEALYQKIVIDHQGGYCYELNRLFLELLLTLGYEARACVARSTTNPQRTDPINHRGTLVELDGKTYLADVGFGGPTARGPILLEDVGVQTVCGGGFVVTPGEDTWWHLRRVTGEADEEGHLPTAGIMDLTTIPVIEEDFTVLNHFCSRPGALFHDKLLANICTKDGHASLTDEKLVIRKGADAETRTVAPDEVDAVLRKVFKIRL